MPSQSKAQQRFFGMVHAVQKGEIKPPSKKVEEVAKSISKRDAREFAATKRKNLPEHKKKEKKAYYQKIARLFTNWELIKQSKAFKLGSIPGGGGTGGGGGNSGNNPPTAGGVPPGSGQAPYGPGYGGAKTGPSIGASSFPLSQINLLRLLSAIRKKSYDFQQEIS